MKDIEYYMNLEYPVEIVPDYVEGGYAAQYPDLPGCITFAETMEEVLDAWQTLTDKDRDIIRMRYAEEKTVPEMAALLDVRESTIYSALFRARKHLTEHLKKEKNHHEE